MGCAFELAKLGVKATVFDGDELGGVPRKSIPSFRLALEELQDDTRFISQHFQLIQKLIDNSQFERLKRDHDAVFFSVGLGRDRAIGIKGENLRGVVPVLNFLDQAKRTGANVGENVVIVGGGNVSLDAAATAKRLGASSVVLIYRRSEKEMRVWKSELNEARAQGVELRFLTTPVEIFGTECVSGVLYRRTKLSDRRDSTGRRIPEEIAGSEHTLTADTVIVAIGQEIPREVFPTLRRTAAGYIAVNESFMTSEQGVFAGGDAIAGEGTIVQSVGQGKRAAHAIFAYVQGDED
jgi:NADPH-dependent glutamate synthase beta subunit-like oxidoreductase